MTDRRTFFSRAAALAATCALARTDESRADGPMKIIFDTDLAGDIDDAFARRLSVVVDFPDPDGAQRRRLWDAVVRLSGLPDPGG